MRSFPILNYFIDYVFVQDKECGRPKRRREDNIKMDLRKIGVLDVWIGFI
jgi:hypothetical protein